jgi:hypothetical protein
MALSDFEIAVGGITSIPVLGGLVWLSYKTWGERNLDASKLNAKKPQTPVKKQETKPKAESKPTDSTNEKSSNPDLAKQEIKPKADSKIADSKNDKNLKSEVKAAQDPTNTSKP